MSQIWHRISKASEGRPGTAEPASPTPLLTERKRLRGGTLFWGYNQQRAVRQRPWKISFRATGLDPEQLALFNLANNLDEKDDPPAAEAERLKVMMAALAAREKGVGIGPPVADTKQEAEQKGRKEKAEPWTLSADG